MHRSINDGRDFLKDHVRKHTDFSSTDQNRGVEPPPVHKPCPADVRRIALPRPDPDALFMPLGAAIHSRESRRHYGEQPLSLQELSTMLWATQGIHRTLGPGTALRTVPSAGARHALETYLCILDVEGLEAGLYRYLPGDHDLAALSVPADLGSQLPGATLGQTFTASAAVVFVWTCIPYRMEWRYAGASYKVIALDAGHLCQNLYLACEAVGCGTCAIAAYDQDLMDELVNVDGIDEFVVYLAPVGKVAG